MPDTRGDVLCPTCGQWTPPAPFCTECGATLQVGFQDGPGDGGSSAYRRGHEVDQPGSPWSSAERFEPEPEDQAARAAAAAAGGAGAGRIDHLSEVEPPAEPAAEPPWPSEPGLPVEPEPAPSDEAATPPPAAPRRRSRSKAAEAAAVAAVAAGAVGAADAVGAGAPEPAVAAAEPPPQPPVEALQPPPIEPPPPTVTYTGPPSDGGDDGNSGVTGLVFVLFLGLGVLALLGGAILGGVFDGPVAEVSPTPSQVVATATPEPSTIGTPEASSASVGPTPSVLPTATPTPAEDGFLARAEPCEDVPTAPSCGSSGAVNSGSVWILVSFRHAQPTDVIAVEVLDSGGTVRDESSMALNFCGTNTDCAGYTYFLFGNLAAGDYDVRVSRNGSQVTTTEFTVE